MVVDSAYHSGYHVGYWDLHKVVTEYLKGDKTIKQLRKLGLEPEIYITASHTEYTIWSSHIVLKTGDYVGKQTAPILVGSRERENFELVVHKGLQQHLAQVVVYESLRQEVWCGT